MNGIDGIGGIGGIGDAIQANRVQPVATTGDGDFLAALLQGMDRVQQDNTRASTALAALAAREDIAAHDVILAMEQARLSLQLAGEVRQRLLDAYKEITGMQI
jgi:flagellar hook-basal body complex protein FliE